MRGTVFRCPLLTCGLTLQPIHVSYRLYFENLSPSHAGLRSHIEAEDRSLPCLQLIVGLMPFPVNENALYSGPGIRIKTTPSEIRQGPSSPFAAA